MTHRQHPAALLLIEPDQAGWRIVSRETTWCGLKRGEAPKIAEHPCLKQARRHLAKMKGRLVKNDV